MANPNGENNELVHSRLEEVPGFNPKVTPPESFPVESTPAPETLPSASITFPPEFSES